MTTKKKFWVLRLGPSFAAALLLATVLFAARVFAQQEDDSGTQEGATTVPAEVQASLPQTSSGQTTTQSGAPPTSPADAEATSQAQRNPISLENGLPLKAVISPLHWGHLSLLSANLLGAYTTDANTRPGATGGAGAGATYANGLVVYSIERAKSELNLQYMPTVWAAAGRVQTDFTAHAVDFQTVHHFNANWLLAVNDRFQFTPHNFFWTSTSFAPDFSNNSASDNPFLLIGRKALMDVLGVTVSRTANGRDQLSLGVDGDYVRLSPTSDPNANTPAFPSDQQLASSARAAWTRTLSEKSTFSVTYDFRNQREQRYKLNTDFQDVHVGYSRRLWPTVTASLQAGPGWSSQGTRTFEGGLSLFKSFHSGGIAAEFQRGTNFVGVLGTTYNNRYNVSVTRQTRLRWNFMATYSYVQQEFLRQSQQDASIAYLTVGYRLTRMWSLYSSYYYINPSGSRDLLNRRQVVAAGIRWAWTPTEGKRN